MFKAIQKIQANLIRYWANPVSRAIGFTFAADSFMFGSWVAHIPHVKSQLGLDDAELGLALFGLPVGLMLANPVSPKILARMGLARATTLSTLLMAAFFALPIWMPDRWTLLLALVFAGAAIAVLNVAMNTCATNFERAEGVLIMSSCHGMWSMGGMLGSGGAAILITMNVAPKMHLSAVAAVTVLLAWLYLRPCIQQVPDDQRAAEMREGSPGFVWPNRDLFLMIFVGFCVSLGEGVAFDWSAVYLRDVLNAIPQIAALGFTAFSFAMMAMRFTGDLLIPKFGERRLLYFCGALTAIAMGVIILSVTPAMGLSGFLMLGAGVALAAPILFNAVARIPGYGQGAGLATYATFSFIGFLAGPPVIGWAGKQWGLPMAFGLVFVAAICILPVVQKISLFADGGKR